MSIQHAEKTLDITDQILSTLEKLNMSLDSIEDHLQMTENILEEVSNEFLINKSFQNRLWKACHRFGGAAGVMTQDVEVGLSRRKVESYVQSKPLEPFIVEEEGQKIEGVPTEIAKLHFSMRSFFSIEDCSVIETKWLVRFSNGDSKQYLVRNVVSFKISDDGSMLHILMCNGTRWFDIDGKETNPFSMLPRKDQIRGKVQRQVEEKLRDSIEGEPVKLPAPSIGDLSISFNPHYLYITKNSFSGFLGVLSKSINRGRSKEPLISYVSNYDQVVKIHKNHITPKIHNTIASQGVDVEGISFGYGQITTNIHKHVRKIFLHIDTNVNVWMEHELTFPESTPGYLISKADWRRWSYNIDIDRCWPVCGKVMKKARALTMEQINQHKYFSAPFVNLGWKVRNAQTRITPFGIIVYMEEYL